MKYILITIALSLSLPAHAMQQYDAEAVAKIKALNKQAQRLIIESMEIVAGSSLEYFAQEAFMNKYQGFLPKTQEYLFETQLFIGQVEYQRAQAKKKIEERQKFWFFNPEAFTVEEYEDIDVLKDAAAMKERVDALLAATE